LPANKDSLERAANILLEGGVVCIPTDTVYGIACIATDSIAVSKVFEVKQRDLTIALPIFIKDISSLNDLSKFVPPIAKVLASNFWPGPLTMVLEKSDCIPDVTTGGLKTAGFRIPNHQIAVNLCEKTGKPITGTSANISGQKAATTADEALRQFNGSSLDLILDGGTSTSSRPSTIVHFEDNEVKLIRQGVITMSDIQKLVGKKRG
jgi:L-threonylcarbamoyladenylate synthase